MERSVYKMLSMLRLPETRVCLIFAVLVTFLLLLNKHLIQDPFSQDVKTTRNTSSSELLLNGQIFTDDSVSVTFVEKHCDLQGLDWYPEEDNNAWQQRAPYFLLIGGEKAQSSRLADALRQHPNILTVPIFLPKLVRGKTQVKDVRSALHNQTLSFSNPDMVGFDSTPDSLFQSPAPYSILCICPWVKIVIIVQNPIDRILSSWKVYKQQAKAQFSLEDWIDGDMKSLRDNGVVIDWNTSEQFTSFSDSPQLEAAWRKYSSGDLPGNQPVGRSLFSIQLKHWFKAVLEAGRRPKDIFLVVRLEDLENNPSALYKQMTDWLKLPPLLNLTFPPVKKSTQKSADMKNSTYQRLQRFFKPYNEQTYALLQGEWSGLWDETGKEREGVVIWPAAKQNEETDDKSADSSLTKSVEQKPVTLQTPAPSRLPRISKAPKPVRETKLPTVRGPSHNRNKGGKPDEPQNLTGADAFVAQWCDVKGGSDFFSNEKAHSWQLRAPYFILMGAKWSGAAVLTSCIMQHPMVSEEKPASKEFFLLKNFRKFISRNDKTKVFPARAFMYARHYNRIQRRLKSNASFISFDATLGYLFASPQIQRILCVAPWTKFVVLLRDPVEQAYSIWADAVSIGLKQEFDEWVAADIQIMRDTGLIQDWDKVSFDEFAGSKKEEDAWMEYQQLVQEGAVGRGMYEIQLRLWFRAIEALGRSPKTELLIFRAETLSRSPQAEFSRILKFLKLPDLQLSSDALWSSSNYSQGMTEKTRLALNNFYAPYNRRLSKLIGDNPNWGGKLKDWLTK